nr:basic proline-rich protein-like [Aegilops tauschii subsp. strangulata]
MLPPPHPAAAPPRHPGALRPRRHHRPASATPPPRSPAAPSPPPPGAPSARPAPLRRRATPPPLGLPQVLTGWWARVQSASSLLRALLGGVVALLQRSPSGERCRTTFYRVSQGEQEAACMVVENE